MGNDLQISDEERLDQALKAFEMSVAGKTNTEIAEVLTISIRTVTNRLTLARKIINEHLLLEGKSHFADIWAKYNWMFEQSQSEWKTSRNPAFLLAMNGILKSMREMLAIDRNDKGASPDKDAGIVMVLDDKEYQQKENIFKEEMANSNVVINETDKGNKDEN